MNKDGVDKLLVRRNDENRQEKRGEAEEKRGEKYRERAVIIGRAGG